MTTLPDPVTPIADADNPTPLRWGLNDVLWGDDDSVIVLLSGPEGEPYWLELEPERAAALREDLAGPEGDPIARVRALHTGRPNGTCAARCYSTGMAPEPWPCPTIRALDAPTTA